MKIDQKRILIFQSDLRGGGAERTIVNLVNGLDRSLYRPILVLNRAHGPYLDFLNKDVTVLELGSARLRHSLFRLVSEIRRQKPDLFFATMQGPSFMLWLARALSCTQAPLVLRESNNWTSRGVKATSLTQRFVGVAYRRANRVVCLSDGVNVDVGLRYGAVSTETIYNPIDIFGIRSAAKEKSGLPDARNLRGNAGTFNIVAAGRLTRQKGFDLLIEALGSIRHLPWHLTILGEGAERDRLTRQARDLGLEDRVLLLGFLRNPYPVMASSDLFVLSSRWEGFGHVLAEAMALGVPVVAYRCPSGPDEIISDGIDGILCEANSTDALAKAIWHLYDKPGLRHQLARSAEASVMRFEMGRMVQRYQSLFEELLPVA